MSFCKKYLKYKSKYINQKKLFGGSSNSIETGLIETPLIETALIEKKNLPNEITDIIDGETYNFDSFLNLDTENNNDRRIAFLVTESAIIPFALYMIHNSDQLKNNDNIYYQCIGVETESAIEIRESNIDIRKPLFKLSGLQTIYVDFNKLKSIKKSNHKFWLFEKEKVINKIVSRKLISRPRSNQLNIDGQLLESEGTTRCITSTYDVYDIKKLFIEKLIELDQNKINSLSDSIGININLSREAIGVYIDDFFRLNPDRKIITETSEIYNLILDIDSFIIKTMKVQY